MTLVRRRDGSPQRIAAVHRKPGLAQRPFAEGIGVTRNVVMRYEGGTLPRAVVLDRIAYAGGVSVDYLLHGRRNGQGELVLGLPDPRPRARPVDRSSVLEHDPFAAPLHHPHRPQPHELNPPV